MSDRLTAATKARSADFSPLYSGGIQDARAIRFSSGNRAQMILIKNQTHLYGIS